jgi:hypothetical protein
MGEPLHGPDRVPPLKRRCVPLTLQVIGDELHARNNPAVIDGSPQARTAKKDLGRDDFWGKGRTAYTVFEYVCARAGHYLSEEIRSFSIKVIEVFLV